MWPPSNAGIGNKFKTASITESQAVIFQNTSQFHVPGKILPIAIKLPTDLYAFVLGLKINPSSFR